MVFSHCLQWRLGFFSLSKTHGVILAALIGVYAVQRFLSALDTFYANSRTGIIVLESFSRDAYRQYSFAFSFRCFFALFRRRRVGDSGCNYSIDIYRICFDPALRDERRAYCNQKAPVEILRQKYGAR